MQHYGRGEGPMEKTMHV